MYSQKNYRWTAVEVNKKRAFIVVDHGRFDSQYKFAPANFGFRCVNYPIPLWRFQKAGY